MDVLVLERTRSGLPALWEKGGGWSNTHLAGGEHALFVVRPGDHVIKASHHRVRVYRIVQIEDGEQPKAYAWDMGEWVPPLPTHLWRR